MPDISMCHGWNDLGECPDRHSCYRHIAKPSKWQTYFKQAPFRKTEMPNVIECEYFWDEHQGSVTSILI
jgi:hypothetical protein